MIAERLGQFEIKHLLGSGGFGNVFAAVDTELGRPVAIKALRAEVGSNPALVERFRAEAMSLARLNHGNITTLYALQRHGQELFLIMELVEGLTLDTVLATRRRLGLTEARAILAQTARGLAYAHRNEVIHRDIKPSNLMLTNRGIIKVMDFGIARIRGTQRLTKEGLLGTYAYLAPEQFRGGEGNERSDLYSLACVTYEMLSGRIPFDAKSEADMMRSHIEAPPPFLRESLPDIDPHADAAMQRALAKRPEDRFETVEAFASAFDCDSVAPQTLEVLASELQHDFALRATRISAPINFSQPLPQQQSNEIDKQQRPPKPWRGPLIAFGAVVATIVAGAGAYFSMSRPGTLATVPAPAVSPPLVETTLPKAVVPAIARMETGGDDTAKLLQSEQLLNSNRAGEAESLLVTSARHNFLPAIVRLARLYNPMLNDRPPGFEPSAARSARYYRDAIATGGNTTDPDVQHERDELRGYLQTRSKDGDTDATIILRTFLQ